MKWHELMGMSEAEFTRLQKAASKGAERERRRQQKMLGDMLARSRQTITVGT